MCPLTAASSTSEVSAASPPEATASAAPEAAAQIPLYEKAENDG